MLTHAVATTTTLAVVSLASKMMSQPMSTERQKAAELLMNCLHWRDLAVQDTKVTLRLQHAATAATFLQSARLLVRDAEIERMSAMDVNRLARAIEDIISDSRKLLDARKECTPRP
jgi:hypothetical protein